jgi:pimeloyl-ACP methyl ester carboxylesterase
MSEFKEIRFTSADGLSLYGRVYGKDETRTPTVVCLPGLTRNSRDFHGLAVRLAADGFRVVTIDSRGRGNSDFAKDIAEYNVVTEAEDVLAGLAALGIEHAAFIGTSRGGLLIHVLAGMRPTVMRAVVLNDIGPVIELDGLFQIRGYLGQAPALKSWGEAATVQRALHGKAFPVLTDDDWMRHSKAIYRQDAMGKIIPDYDPQIAQTLAGLKADAQLPPLWIQFDGLKHLPMMILRGENTRLLSQKTFDEMRARHPDSVGVTVPGQGHAPMLDTGTLPAQISQFLKAAIT